ncbi:hypothetical protein Z043_110229 [Scleropages formosus]|uniref:Uncharacterized protein n=1 Tax=Scleropages formosus TaxID=113540 RepID=A0A0P7X8U3_SCLFO|nr:hypothetical protein Z043_110229 [Scleropages formosus]
MSQSTFELSLSHHNWHVGHPIRTLGLEEDEWDGTVSLCLLFGPGDCEGQRTIVEVSLFGQTRVGDQSALGSTRFEEFLFPLTTVDGCREDDINVLGESGKETEREGESFRSLFWTESCPAPFVWGSRFYCFHGPFRESVTSRVEKPRLRSGLDLQAPKLYTSLPVAHCNYPDKDGRRRIENDREREREEKLALMYERLRIELPSFFIKDHDYSMYSVDVEFINGLLNTKTRGRVVYRMTLTLWQLLCRLCLADVRFEVLKLTKHSEDGTVRARWRVRGQPFYLMPLRLYRRDKTSLYRTYDAFSTFYLGPDGLVHCHRVEKVMQAQPPALPRVTSLLAGALVALGTQDHRPALNLLPFLLSSLRLGRY